MKSTPRETRRLSLSGVVRKGDDVREMSRIVEKALTGIPASENGDVTLSFSFVTEDGSYYESTSCSIYLTDGPLDREIVSNIDMALSDGPTDSYHIVVTLKRPDPKRSLLSPRRRGLISLGKRPRSRSYYGGQSGGKPKSNFIEIIGKDREWVEIATGEFEAIIRRLRGKR